MSARTRRLLPWILLAGCFAVLAGRLELGAGFAFSDYDSEAAPGFTALAHGHFAQFASQAPSYGGSMLIRAPFALAAGALGAGQDALYRAVSAPGLLALLVLGAALAALARRRGAPLLGCAAVAGLVVAGPPALSAVRLGHAEEGMVAVLAVASVLAARRGHGILAGVVLGLAVAGKPWAIVVAGPVLACLGRGAWRAGLAAALTAAAILAPLALAGSGPTGFASSARLVATNTGPTFKPADVWWFAGQRTTRLIDGSVAPAGARLAPTWVSRISRPVLVLLAAALSALWWRRARRSDVLGLLALVLLLRCALDPWDNLYYHLPLLLALVAWEVRAGRRWPAASIAAAAAMQVCLVLVPDVASRDAACLAYLAVALPGIAALALAVFAPDRTAALWARVAAPLRRDLRPARPRPRAGRPRAPGAPA